MEKNIKRIKDLLSEFVNELEEQYSLFISENVNIKFEWDGLANQEVYGVTQYEKEIRTDLKIILNLFRLRFLSDKAIKGVIAHELGHALHMYNKSKLRMWVERRIWNTENIADKKAQRLGFESEIAAMHEEAEYRKMYRIQIPTSEVRSLNNTDSIKLSFPVECDTCNEAFSAEFIADSINRQTHLHLNERGAPAAYFKVDCLTELEEMSPLLKCFRCKKGKLRRIRDSFEKEQRLGN